MTTVTGRRMASSIRPRISALEDLDRGAVRERVRSFDHDLLAGFDTFEQLDAPSLLESDLHHATLRLAVLRDEDHPILLLLDHRDARHEERILPALGHDAHLCEVAGADPFRILRDLD